MNIPRTNAEGVELIKHFEGLRLEAYMCPARRLTIGYGHTGRDVFPGQKITEEKAGTLLHEDLLMFEKGVYNVLEGIALNSDRFSALVSFAYNMGLGALSSSTLLRKIKSGDMSAVPVQLMRWCYAGNSGKKFVLPGLVKRRNAEANLWNSEDWRHV